MKIGCSNVIAVCDAAFGGHAVALEIMDSMFKPEQYGGVYLGAFFYIFSLTLPHSIAANLAFPHKANRDASPPCGILKGSNIARQQFKDSQMTV